MRCLHSTLLPWGRADTKAMEGDETGYKVVSLTTLLDLLLLRSSEGREGRCSGGIPGKVDSGSPVSSCLCRCEVKNKAEQEGHFPLSSFPGQSLVSGPQSGLKEPT